MSKINCIFNKDYFLIVGFCFFNLLFSFNYHAQIKVNDLGKSKQDTNIVNHLNIQTLNYKNNNPYKALQYAKQSSQLAAKLNFNSGLFKSFVDLTDIYYYLGYIDSSYACMKYTEIIYNKHSNSYNKANFLALKGKIFVRKNNFDSATSYLLQSLKLYKNQKDSLGMAHSLMMLANINVSLQLKKAFHQNIAQAFSILKYKKDSAIITDLYFTKALFHASENNLDSATIEYYNSLTNCPKNNLLKMDRIFSNLATTYGRKENYDSVLYYLKKASAIELDLGLKHRHAINQVNMATLFFLKENYIEAETTALKILPSSKTFDDPDLVSRILELLSDINIRKKNYNLALDYYKQSVSYNDSVQQRNNRKQVIDISTKYETEKKDAQITLLNKDKELSQKEVQKQRYIKLFISSIALFLVFLAGFLFYNYQQKNKSNHLLQLQKDQIETKNNQLEQQKKDIELQNTLLGNRNQLITDSIEYARKIQDSMLPNKTTLFDYFRDALIYYQPKDIVSGDFYWLQASENGIVIALADCTGHGVPGALMSVLGNNCLDSAYSQLKDVSPAKVLRYLDTYMKQKTHQATDNITNSDGMALSLIDYNKKTQKIRFSSANHYIYVVRNNEVIEIKRNGFSIGSLQGQEILEGNMQLQKNDTLYLFSDGFPDQKGGPEKRKYMYPKLKELFIKLAPLSGAEQEVALKSEMDKWKGNLPQVDDILVLGVKV